MKAEALEKKRRIQLSVWAWAYEQYNVSFVPDAKYDSESLKVNLNVATDRPDLDIWFKDNFMNCSGMWIHKHPELSRIDEIVFGIIEEQTRQRKKNP